MFQLYKLEPTFSSSHVFLCFLCLYLLALMLNDQAMGQTGRQILECQGWRSWVGPWLNDYCQAHEIAGRQS